MKTVPERIILGKFKDKIIYDLEDINDIPMLWIYYQYKIHLNVFRKWLEYLNEITILSKIDQLSGKEDSDIYISLANIFGKIIDTDDLVVIKSSIEKYINNYSLLLEKSEDIINKYFDEYEESKSKYNSSKLSNDEISLFEQKFHRIRYYDKLLDKPAKSTDINHSNTKSIIIACPKCLYPITYNSSSLSIANNQCPSCKKPFSVYAIANSKIYEDKSTVYCDTKRTKLRTIKWIYNNCVFVENKLLLYPCKACGEIHIVEPPPALLSKGLPK